MQEDNADRQLAKVRESSEYFDPGGAEGWGGGVMPQPCPYLAKAISAGGGMASGRSASLMMTLGAGGSVWFAEPLPGGCNGWGLLPSLLPVPRLQGTDRGFQLQSNDSEIAKINWDLACLCPIANQNLRRWALLPLPLPIACVQGRPNASASVSAIVSLPSWGGIWWVPFRSMPCSPGSIISQSLQQLGPAPIATDLCNHT